MDRFTPVPEIRDYVDRLFDEFQSFQRGRLLPWRRIELILGHSIDEGRGRYIVDLFRRRLRQEKGIVTRAVYGQGLRFLTHEDALTDVPIYRFRKAARQMHYGLSESKAISTRSMGVHKKAFHAQTVLGMRRQRRHLQRTAREAKLLRESLALPSPQASRYA